MAIAKRLLIIPIVILAIAAGYWWGIYSSENPSTLPLPRIKIASAENSALICAFMHTIPLTGIPGEKKHSQKHAARTNRSFCPWDIRVAIGAMSWNGWFSRIRILPT